MGWDKQIKISFFTCCLSVTVLGCCSSLVTLVVHFCRLLMFTVRELSSCSVSFSCPVSDTQLWLWFCHINNNSDSYRQPFKFIALFQEARSANKFVWENQLTDICAYSYISAKLTFYIFTKIPIRYSFSILCAVISSHGLIIPWVQLLPGTLYSKITTLQWSRQLRIRSLHPSNSRDARFSGWNVFTDWGCKSWYQRTFWRLLCLKFRVWTWKSTEIHLNRIPLAWHGWVTNSDQIQFGSGHFPAHPV